MNPQAENWSTLLPSARDAVALLAPLRRLHERVRDKVVAKCEVRLWKTSRAWTMT